MWICQNFDSAISNSIELLHAILARINHDSRLPTCADKAKLA